MINRSYKKLIALLLILVFSSQLMAASLMTCELENIFKMVPDHVHGNHMDHSEHMSHGMESPDLTKVPDTTKRDADHSTSAQHKSFCCKTIDHCLLGCALIAINNHFSFQLEIASSGIEDFYSGRSSSPFIASLYRPPILG